MNHFTKIAKIILMGVLALGITFGPQSAWTVQAAEASTQQTVQTPTYQVYVNRIANCVTVYTKDADGEYTVPVRSFACSTGREGMETPLGSFKTSDYYTWRLMVDGSYGQYAIRFNRGILFHSVPYYTSSADNLEKDQFNLLGSQASLGCVRMAASDVKWLMITVKKAPVLSYMMMNRILDLWESRYRCRLIFPIHSPDGTRQIRQKRIHGIQSDLPCI